ncbi:MAG: hypothetical protein D6722_11595 [Bacteroidetes bacterium]|nr:MAG: hypothetical protein D6722_11595 [Bacteroidota bacterium]
MKTQTLYREQASEWTGYAGQPVVQPDLVLFFGGTTEAAVDDHFHSLKVRYPDAIVAGCSTAGNIIGDEVRADEDAVAVLVELASSQVRSRLISCPEDPYSAGRQLVEDLLTDELQAIFLLSDGHDVNGSQLVAGMMSVLPAGVVLTGGLAGDGGRFERTAVACDGPAQAGQIAAIGFYGSAFQAYYGSFGGWAPFGPVRYITRARDNVLYELDGQPALRLYKQYLGAAAEELPGSALRFPLNISQPDGEGLGTVRTILSIDEETQSLTFAGDMPEGYRAQLMSASFEAIIEGAGQAAQRATDGIPVGTEPPQLAILISCVGRRIVLGHRTEDELEAVLEAMPEAIPTLGFYSNGEVAPQGLKTDCRLHNQTMTITCFSESS